MCCPSLARAIATSKVALKKRVKSAMTQNCLLGQAYGVAVKNKTYPTQDAKAYTIQDPETYAIQNIEAYTIQNTEAYPIQIDGNYQFQDTVGYQVQKECNYHYLLYPLNSYLKKCLNLIYKLKSTTLLQNNLTNTSCQVKEALKLDDLYPRCKTEKDQRKKVSQWKNSKGGKEGKERRKGGKKRKKKRKEGEEKEEAQDAPRHHGPHPHQADLQASTQS